MASGESKKRRNINFRQTPKEFKSAKQEQVYQHIKTNIPYSILVFAKQKLVSAYSVIKNNFTGSSAKLPEGARKIK